MLERVANLAAGAALGRVVAVAGRRLGGARRSLATAGLGAEALALVGAVVAARVVMNGSPPARRVLAVGWVGHSVFDLCIGPSPDSRLPSWYADLCAGYDIAFAAAILRPA